MDEDTEDLAYNARRYAPQFPGVDWSRDQSAILGWHPPDDGFDFGDFLGAFVDPLGWQYEQFTGRPQAEFETAVVAAAGGTLALEALGGGSSFVGDLPTEEFALPPDVGRPPLTAQQLARWAAVASGNRTLAAASRLAPLIGRTIVDDDWSYDPETGDVNMGGSSFELPSVGSLIRDYGPSGVTPMMGVTQTGALGGAMMAGAGLGLRSLWSVLRAGGARFGTWVGQNGVKARLADLWPAVRKYGAGPVAFAMGIGVDQLTQLLMQAPHTSGHRRRRRGITARDMSTTKRTLRTVKRMYFAMPKRSGGGGRSYRPYYPRRSRGRY